MVKGKRDAASCIGHLARIGSTQWRTSVFPSRTAGGFLLPVKAAVRKAERLHEGDLVAVAIGFPQGGPAGAG